MGEFTRQPARDIKSALIDSVLAGLCALIVFGPIVGVVLKGYGFTLAPARVAILVAVVMAEAAGLLPRLVMATRVLPVVADWLPP